tara:strand:+ start:418 stop:1107 length:690 start_codon:yes stop_codon:yes gene_type:complete
MNIIKFDTTTLLKNYSNYTLNNNDKNRITGLLDLIKKYDINFKYFITISPYNYVPNTQKGRDYITAENKFLRKTIRKFYKSNIRMWFFTESYSNVGKHSGGLHRHILIEDAPEERWKHPTNDMQNFLLKYLPEGWFNLRSSDDLNNLHKVELLKRVCRLCRQTPNGKQGLDIRRIDDLEKLTAYCTKQIKSVEKSFDVIDAENSDYVNQLNFPKDGQFQSRVSRYEVFA